MSPNRGILVVISYRCWFTLWLAAAIVQIASAAAASGSKLKGSDQENGLLKRNVGGILVGTTTSKPIVIPFDSTETIAPASASRGTYGVAFDWNSGRVYWLEDNIGIMRSNLNGSESEVLFSDPSSWLYGIAIEPISGNLYYGNWTSGTIKICNNDATKCSTIASSPEEFVFDFAFHSSKGLLFWSIRETHIVQANLDGSNATILDVCSVRGLEVDELEDRLYWGSSAGITSRDLNTGGIRLLPNVEGVVQDVAINNENIYYTAVDTKDILVVSKFGSISSSVKRLTNYPYWNIALFGQRASSKPPNPCENSECAHLCVLKSPSSYRCLCADDEELNSDGKTCRFTATSIYQVASLEFRNLMLWINRGSALVPTV